MVISPGSGSNFAHWPLVQPEVSKFARICIYDCLGSGWSFGTPQGQTYQEEAEDVHTLLYKAGVDGPYVLVGLYYFAKTKIGNVPAQSVAGWRQPLPQNGLPLNGGWVDESRAAPPKAPGPRRSTGLSVRHPLPLPR